MPGTAVPLGFRLLGAVEVEGVPRSMLGGPKQRALLAYLLLHANEFVPRDRLVDAVWGDGAPATARSIVQGYIHKLRIALDETPAKIVTRSGGYVLEVEADELDARRFERLAMEAREALARDPAHAQELLEQALGLWRGEPLADLTYEPAVEADARRLSDLWLEATMDHIDAQIALGGDVALLGELESLVSRHPLSERLRGQLMLAYYRAGRQAEALNTYRETRRFLVEQLGLEPSAELKELERAILAHEVDGWGAPAAGGHPRTGSDAVDREPASPRRMLLGRLGRLPRRRAALVVGTAVVVGLALAALLEVTESPSTATIPVPPNAIGLIDPKVDKVVATTPFPVGSPGAVAAGAGSLWVGSLTDQTITIVNPQTRTVDRTISFNTYPSSIAFGAGALWVFEDSLQPDQAALISRVSPDGTVTRHAVPKGPISALGGHDQNTCGITGAGQQRSPITVGEGRVWFVCVDGTLGSFDPRSNRMQIGTYEGRGTPTAIAVNSDGVWVTDLEHDLLMQIDPSTHKTLQTFTLDGEPRGIVATPGSVWVTNFTTDKVSRIDLPGAGLPAKQTAISVGHGPTSIAYDEGAVWVASADKTVSRIDPKSNRVTATIPIGSVPVRIGAGEGRVWVTTGR